jgi:GxxExxY protein
MCLREKLLYEEEYYKIIGLCMKVHNKLSKTHKEAIYQDALEIEFRKNDIPYEREKILFIQYEGEQLRHSFKIDFLLYGCMVLEIKAIKSLSSAEFKQTLNYLKVSGIKLAILVNFGADRLTHQRIICSDQ